MWKSIQNTQISQSNYIYKNVCMQVKIDEDGQNSAQEKLAFEDVNKGLN